MQEAKHATRIPLPEETITTPEVQEAPLSRLAYSTSASTQVHPVDKCCIPFMVPLLSVF